MAVQRSLTGKQWLVRPEFAHTSLQNFTKELQRARGITDAGIPGTYAQLHKAADRIVTAKEQQQMVGIFGDYDCDGITAAAQLVRYCRRHHIPYVVYLPHRVRDGYGLQMAQVERFAHDGVQLLITVDTGITGVKEVALAKELGIDVLITDHHTPPAVLPDAYAILHPMLEENFPQPHPSGAGVAYALVQALEQGDWAGKSIDTALAAIGTIADIVPLQGANRALVQEGIAALQQLRQCPLADMRDATKSKTSIDIAFRMAPRINAAGRMADPSIALEALIDGGSALHTLDALNETRQKDTQTMYDQAVADITAPEEALLLWSASKTYTHGILGLIAGRLTEAYGKPSCIVTMQNSTCTASLRSPSAYHITQGLQRCSAHLISFGGHAQAAGCSFAVEQLDTFAAALQADIAAHTTADQLVPTLQIDKILSPQELTLQFIQHLQPLEPYGQGNAEPRFLLQNVQLQDVRLVGADKNHVQCRIANHKAIGFSLGKLEPYFADRLDVVCRLGIDTWNSHVQPQLFLEDIRRAV